MFNLEKQITEWRRRLYVDGIKDRDVLDELEAHLRDEMERLQPEVRDEATFQAAAQRLGDVRQLKREFAKVNRFRFWLPRENPTELNLAGLLFMLLGLDVICSVTRMLVVTWLPGTSSLLVIGVMTVWAFFGVQFFIGLGLLHRRNFWRMAAFAMSVLQVISCLFSLWVRLFGPLKNDVGGSYFPFMGVMVPMRFHWIPDVLTIGMVIWACVYLSKPAVRNLFRSGGKIRIA